MLGPQEIGRVSKSNKNHSRNHGGSYDFGALRFGGRYKHFTRDCPQSEHQVTISLLRVKNVVKF